MKRVRRAWVFLYDHTRQLFNIYRDEKSSLSCIKWNGVWYNVIYRPEYGEYDLYGKLEDEIKESGEVK